MTSNLTRVAQEVVLQTIGGLVIGTAVDNIFDPQFIVFDGNFIKIAGETALQLGLAGMATTAWYEFLYKRGLRGEVCDYNTSIFGFF
jgi:hypothetical protein